MEINITSIGAVGDGIFENAEIIQRAIDMCNNAGGGRVVIPAGKFKTGSIELKSNVELHLSIGAVLFASEELDNYNTNDAFSQNTSSQNEGWNGCHLIYCVEQKNVALTGLGTIDGNGYAFYDDNEPNENIDFAWQYGWRGPKDKVRLRPGQLVMFAECDNIHVENVTMQNGTCWTLFFYGCNYVTVHGIHIFNPVDFLNTDGVDIDTCRYVTVSDCVILTGDDAIAIRGNGKHLADQRDRACEFVTVTNCVLRSSACAVRIGVGTFPISHVNISQLTVERAGICICFCPEWVPSRGTPLNDISVTGVKAKNAGCAVCIKDHYGTPADKISVTDLFANAECAFIITGDEACKANIKLGNIDICEIRDYSNCENTKRRTKEPFAIRQNLNASFENVVLEKLDSCTLTDIDDLNGITVIERK